MALNRLAAIAFELLYGPAAPIYDWVSRAGFLGEWARWQQTALRFVRQGPVLEIGPGTGDLLPLLREQGLQPVGLELSPQMIRRARCKLARGRANASRPTPQVIPPLVRGRSEVLPFLSDTFGAVVATFPSGYIFRPATWAEIARVLRPGGDVAIVLGGDLAPHGLGRALRARAYRLLYGGQSQRVPPLPATPLGLREERVITTHGQALLIVGRKPDTRGRW